jgi:tyrosyl-tRNA synthetase
MMLAKEIVSAFFNEKEGESAEQAFIHQFQMGEVPEEMQEYILKEDQTVLDVMDKAGLIKSRSEGRRLLTQNAVRFDDVILTDPRLLIDHEGVLQVGKRQFVRVKKG